MISVQILRLDLNYHTFVNMLLIVSIFEQYAFSISGIKQVAVEQIFG